MRNLIVLLMLGLTLACGNDQKEKEAPTEYVNETVVEYYQDGKIKLEGNTVNGERHGIWRFYYQNGFVWSEGRFRYGVRDGKSLVYYENGKKRLQGQYKEGDRYGWWLAWNEAGLFTDSINLDETITARDSVLLGIQ